MQDKVKQKCWIVWGVEAGAATNPKRHMSVADAEAEATRLSNLTPGDQYVILETIGYVEAPKPSPTKFAFGRAGSAAMFLPFQNLASFRAGC